LNRLWKEKGELDKNEKRLVQLAMKAQKRAYAPYSNYCVGAAIEDSFGNYHSGCNVENASYSVAICAERAAVAKMVSRGVTRMKRVAVVTSSKMPAFPCGPCLQVLYEMGGKEIIVLAMDRSGEKIFETSVGELFPGAFTKESLTT